MVSSTPAVAVGTSAFDVEVAASPRFPAWLAAQRMGLALSACQQGRLFLIGLDWDDTLVLSDVGLPRCMGLAAHGDGLVVATHWQVWRFDNALPPSRLHEGCDRLYVPRRAWVTGDVAAHDLAVDADGRPVFASALFNCVAAVDDHASFTPLWTPPFLSMLAPEDRCHLNGVALDEGGWPRWAALAGESDVREGWRAHRADGGRVYDLATGAVAAEGLSMPHSPRWYRGRLWLLNAGTGELGWVDPDTRCFRPLVFCPGYPRGLAFVDRFAVVGLSDDGALARLGLEPWCGLVVIDTMAGEIVHWLRFTQGVHELSGVAALPGCRNPRAIGLDDQAIQRFIRVGPVCADPAPPAFEAPALHRGALAAFREGRLGMAEAAVRRTLAVDPWDAAAWNTLGAVLGASGEAEESVEAFRQAVARGRPANPAAHSNLLFALHSVPGFSPEERFHAIRLWARYMEPPHLPSVKRLPRQDGPLRVGYVGAFHMASTRRFALDVLRRHDRAQVTPLCYANTPDLATLGPALEGSFDAVRPIHHLDDAAAAALIRSDGVDVLVDLSGHSHWHRLGVFARRAAPVQVTWVESFFSTGLDAMDYLITDIGHSPEGTAQRFTERLLRLPRPRLCYSPPGSAPAVATAPMLKRGHVTFGCFNHVSKLNRAVLALWASILKEVPTARLLLKWSSFADATVAARLRSRFADLGVDPERIELRGFSEHALMLGEYGDVDVALDPFPYNGGLTTCEALWMGVPVVALRGDDIIGRQSATMLEAIGL
ncbi:MAG TPA: TIGR03032 family protein, partial [Azospirillaceae bacterium]|nr:TIGR03032 family protein [Azospirillaceae bacterium]